MDTKRTVTVDAENKAVSEILDEAFEGTGIHYVMEGHNIVLTRNNEDTASVQQNKLAIKGIVTDTKGEPIIGANILEKGTTNGTITDIDGNFSLNVPADAILVVTYVGYQPQTISVNGVEEFQHKAGRRSAHPRNRSSYGNGYQEKRSFFDLLYPAARRR